MILPIWFLRQLAEPRGLRLRRLTPPTSKEAVAGLCALCNLPVFFGKINGQTQLNGVYRAPKDYYHYICAPRADVKDWESFGRVRSNFTVDGKVPRGNIGQEEYRFWIGCDVQGSDFAMCRACGKSTYGRIIRTQHFQSQKLRWVQCTSMLIQAYNRLRSCNPTCVVCGKQRFNNDKWGVPLCDRLQCEADWKFSQRKYAALEYQLKLIRHQIQEEHKEQIEAEIRKRGMIPVQMVREGEPVLTGWCDLCQMCEDSRNHDKIHEQKLADKRLSDTMMWEGS